MATWTKSKLANKVLQRLCITAVGQDDSAEDKELIEDKIDGVMDQLAGKILAPFAVSAVPTWAQQPLVAVVAASAATEFGYSGAELMQFERKGEKAEIELTVQIQEEDDGAPSRGTYY